MLEIPPVVPRSELVLPAPWLTHRGILWIGFRVREKVHVFASPTKHIDRDPRLVPLEAASQWRSLDDDVADAEDEVSELPSVDLQRMLGRLKAVEKFRGTEAVAVLRWARDPTVDGLIGTGQGTSVLELDWPQRVLDFVSQRVAQRQSSCGEEQQLHPRMKFPQARFARGAVHFLSKTKGEEVRAQVGHLLRRQPPGVVGEAQSLAERRGPAGTCRGLLPLLRGLRGLVALLQAPQNLEDRPLREPQIHFALDCCQLVLHPISNQALGFQYQLGCKVV
mmetsp:Transcript_65991/g.143147  ORF Transcript_65991/g.143147 Transcript_65991/m.143147 type:complete len:278 (-) Transcript_65991:168-1001(-)